MKDKLGKNLATAALDDYLSELLSTDELMACEQSNENTKELSRSKLYHLNTHPSRQLKSQQPDVDKRHHFERVERLLDDFNRRQPIETSELEESDLVVQPEVQVLLQPPILQPETPNKEFADAEQIQEIEQSEVEDTSTENDIDIEEQTPPQQKIIIPQELKLVREDWSKESFQTLLFDVAGLKLALPLVKLGGIHRIDQDITPLFGKPDWFLGLTPGLEGNINVIDTARWVMPDRYNELSEKETDYKFIILLGDSNWGLACNDVQNAIHLEPDNVRWRVASGKRPWLAGVLIEEMCALLDVETLVYLLNENFPR